MSAGEQCPSPAYGADARACRVLMDAMGLQDLDLIEAGSFQSGAELRLGQCPRDAACPSGHVGARCVVHFGIGDHV
jgi:hypothetical protein